MNPKQNHVVHPHPSICTERKKKKKSSPPERSKVILLVELQGMQNYKFSSYFTVSKQHFTHGAPGRLVVTFGYPTKHLEGSHQATGPQAKSLPFSS
jgi:hypothetical protein